MKIKYLLLIIIAVFTNSCSDDLDRNGTYNPEKGITATIPSYPFDDGTRVNISEDLQTFSWNDGDKLGVYYDGTDIQTGIRYTIKQGGSSTGNFSNEVFYLNPTRDYYAFYPFSSTATTLSARIDFTGQVQSGNGSTAHLGAYNYMYGKININTDGGASVPFYNLGSIMQLQLTVSNSVTYTSIDITSDLAKFTTKGVARMTYGGITATEISDSIHFDFKGGLTLNAGDVLSANILIAPVDMSGSTLTITLTDEDHNTYEVNTTGKNMLQGKAYRYSEIVPYKDIQTIPYVTFTAEEKQTFELDRNVSTLEYSLNGGDWSELGNSQVTFGGEHGNLRLRGKSYIGTYNANINFGNETKVACSGDIRTLVDYENYCTAYTGNASFRKFFQNCTQLTSSPKLPATSLAPSCYQYMFDGCTSLTQAPELPATTLALNCYEYMFRGCTALTQAPELPATTLKDYCYQYMFYNCTSLTEAPELPATTLANDCYYYMFYRCTSIISAPDLPATTLADYCYGYMFCGCTSLTSVPELPVTTLTPYCYYFMFSGCTSLTQTPELPATSLAPSCYRYMFSNCENLKVAPELPATILAEDCYRRMFNGCPSLTQAPELPATTLAEYCYYCMFYGCTSLTQAPELPATNLNKGCYEAMFYGCTSLTQAPELPATTLAERCYYYMFNLCSNLSYIRMMATDISAKDCLYAWVNRVSPTGTFVKNKDATWQRLGISGIPSGWTVVTE